MRRCRDPAPTSETLLVVGGSGRKHDLARAIASGIEDRPDADEYRFVACASNRDPGIAELVEGFEVLKATDQDGVQRFWASVDATEDGIVTTTSRAFASVGLGDTIEDAERRVDEAFAETDLSDLRVRHDIAKPALLQDRLDRMDTVRARTRE